MNAEINRLETFRNWPISAPVDPPRIAKAGFYYTGVGLEVQCFWCRGKINHWDHGDQVMGKHRQMKPTCPFVLNPTNSDNIPLTDVFECNNSNDSSHSHVERPEIDEDSGPRDYGLTEEDEMHRNDALRLLSFINWNDSVACREVLVNAGFYYTGTRQLRCVWCGGELTPHVNFTGRENIVDLHRMFFPRCEHTASLEADHRASNFSNSTPLPPPSSTILVTPPIRSPVINGTRALSSGALHNSLVLNASSTWRALGVVGGGPRHSNYASLATRLATFGRWPAGRTQTPKDMAEAGFFLTGSDDQVRCFYCDGGLGMWEAGDRPWSEHARWFPTCGFVLLVKGPEFVEECRPRTPAQTPIPAPSSAVSVGRRNLSTNSFPAIGVQIDEYMESPIALGALSAGLDAARVRRAIVRRVRTTGSSFTTSESLIDAVLDDQLNEEAWSVSSQGQRDMLAETLSEFAPRARLATPQRDSTTSESDRTRSPSPNPATIHRGPPINLNQARQLTNQSRATKLNEPTQAPSQQSKPKNEKEKKNSESDTSSTSENTSLSLEEENRQLKESRLCKVCMDNEVSVVFLPCGHLVSCPGCGAALVACPLCRQPVRALVRAYLA